VWYDPFGEIISHTLPLTLTSRFFTGQQWHDTIGWYQSDTQWYDPQTAQQILPGVEMPAAPPNLRLIAESVPGSVYASDYSLGFGKALGVSTFKGLLGEVVGTPAANAALRVLGSVTTKEVTRQYATPIQIYRKTAGRIWEWGPEVTKFQLETVGWKIVTHTSREPKWVDDLVEWSQNEMTLGPAIVDLGVGVAIDVYFQRREDKSLRDAGILTQEQYNRRSAVTAGASTISWGVGLVAGIGGAAVGTAICPGAGTAAGFMVGFVAEVGADAFLDAYVVPYWYEDLDLYPETHINVPGW